MLSLKLYTKDTPNHSKGLGATRKLKLARIPKRMMTPNMMMVLTKTLNKKWKTPTIDLPSWTRLARL